ncbi:hypothetical protein LO80_03585 [Candidatus Francisella endociliophora]|uniref:Uncharacterized protein n=1 Tax=Candidatus Francisella endociliophora TaxID=653937 RepID=A0A097ENK2_9GAMM|nr:hypothetical protein [Francisella sp. FSC1006]AIT09139.1 hypothetical protein LO80_03585 [Francisella sp. FSC1006]
MNIQVAIQLIGETLLILFAVKLTQNKKLAWLFLLVSYLIALSNYFLGFYKANLSMINTHFLFMLAPILAVIAIAIMGYIFVDKNKNFRKSNTIFVLLTILICFLLINLDYYFVLGSNFEEFILRGVFVKSLDQTLLFSGLIFAFTKYRIAFILLALSFVSKALLMAYIFIFKIDAYYFLCMTTFYACMAMIFITALNKIKK